MTSYIPTSQKDLIHENKSSTNFFSRVYKLVRSIPPGRVATYGQVASLLGSPRGARVVGWALHLLDGQSIPWQRVINGRGEISTTCETHTKLLQKQLLEAEGVDVNDRSGVYVVDLEKYLWRPKIKIRANRNS